MANICTFKYSIEVKLNKHLKYLIIYKEYETFSKAEAVMTLKMMRTYTGQSGAWHTELPCGSSSYYHY